ncbi:MAG: hypothetical protein Q9214_000092 [Letrouitia sp. 1 TL-2023]
MLTGSADLKNWCLPVNPPAAGMFVPPTLFGGKLLLIIIPSLTHYHVKLSALRIFADAWEHIATSMAKQRYSASLGDEGVDGVTSDPAQLISAGLLKMDRYPLQVDFEK